MMAYVIKIWENYENKYMINPCVFVVMMMMTSISVRFVDC